MRLWDNLRAYSCTDLASYVLCCTGRCRRMARRTRILHMRVSTIVAQGTTTPTTTSAPEDGAAGNADELPKKKRVYKPREKKVKVPKQVVEVDENTRLQARATGTIVHPVHYEHKLTDTAFTPALPPVVSPWPHECPAPTSTYDLNIACPVDWSQIEIHHNNP